MSGPAPKLSDAEIEKHLADMDGWSRDGDTIVKAWRFKGFAHGVLFVNAVAHVADQQDHHPDVALGYDYVRLSIMTHNMGAITERDFRLARAIDALPLNRFAEVEGA